MCKFDYDDDDKEVLALTSKYDLNPEIEYIK